MRPPAFWQHGGLLPWLLSPAARVAAASTARRVARPGWRAPVPVLCCGNVTLGGSGKTTLALDLGQRLIASGHAVHFLTRGYGGRIRNPLLVDPAQHDAGLAGDEALLLAAIAPTWAGADRAASAREAVRAGATMLIMDDGLQNPSLVQDLALLVIDGATGFGNGRVVPAGPLREPVGAGAARCQAAVLVGGDATGAATQLPAGLDVLRASLHSAGRDVTNRRVLAFAGIGRPSKFFATLAQAGAAVVATAGFPDHHRYRQRDLDRLQRQANSLGAELWTTPKDAVRLPPAFRARVQVAGVRLAWRDESAVERLLRTLDQP